MFSLHKKYLNYKKTKNTNKKLLNACFVNNIDDIKECLQLDHNINYTNRKGVTPFLACCYSGKLDTIKIIEENGADIHETINVKYNGYIIAAICGNINLMAYLETRGININYLDNNGNNAYINASKYGQVKVLIYLQKHGSAYMYHKNYSGHNAYTIHRIYILCPHDNRLNDIQKSVSYLASIGYKTTFQSKHMYLADMYYQIYYCLKAPCHMIKKSYNKRCNFCDKKFFENQLVFICGHEHIGHVNCYLYYGNNISHYKYLYIYNDTTPLDNCVRCNEPSLNRQSNVRKIKYIEEITNLDSCVF